MITWLTIIPFVLIILVFFFVPGGVINMAAGFNRLSALAFAPPVSVGVIALAAIIWQLFGVPWGVLPIILTTALFAAAAFAVKRFASWRGWVLQRHPERDLRQGWRWGLGGWLIGMVLLSVDLVRILGDPHNFSQTFDDVFHLNAVRWITENRQGSSLAMHMTGTELPTGFYPTAWHDIGSAALLTLNAMDPVQVTNALLIVTMCFVWPLGCVVLVRRLLAVSKLSQLAVGVLSASFIALPYAPMSFGVLYPNLLGLCLLPTMIALAADILDISPAAQSPLLGAWVAAGIGMIALMLSHPNVALTMTNMVGVVLICYWAIPKIWVALKTSSWNRNTSWQLIVTTGWVAAAIAAQVVIRPPASAGRWAPSRTFLDALIETVSISPLDATIVVVPSLLAFVGAVVVVWKRRHLEILCLHAVFCLFWLVAAVVPLGSLREAIVGSWYSDPHRLAALLPLTGLPLAVIGLDFLISSLRQQAKPATIIVVVALLTWLTQADEGKRSGIEWSTSSFRLGRGYSLLSRDEYQLIQRLPALVGKDRVAVNPQNGSSLAYALAGINTNLTHIFYNPTPRDDIINRHLDAISQMPQVCQALNEENIKYVLDFGNVLVDGAAKAYPGYHYLSVLSSFQEVDHQGDAVLYKISGC